MVHIERYQHCNEGNASVAKLQSREKLIPGSCLDLGGRKIVMQQKGRPGKGVNFVMTILI